MSDLVGRLSVAQIASCTCLTKSPAIEVHDPLCRYRLLGEARERIDKLEKQVIATQEMAIQRGNIILEVNQKLHELREVVMKMGVN